MKKIDNIIYLYRIAYLLFAILFLKDYARELGIINDMTSNIIALVIYVSIMYLTEKILRRILEKYLL